MAIVETVSSSPSSPGRLALSSPATLESLGEIEIADENAVRGTVERARKAQPEWAALEIDERVRILRRAMDVVVSRQEDIIECVVAETGKTRTEAIQMEVVATCDSLAYYAKSAAAQLKPRRSKLHGLMRIMKKLEIHDRPLGVIGIITPWNGPFVMPMNPAAQALVAGNAVVLKPSEITPLSGRLVAKVWQEAGLPEGLLQVLDGDASTGAALCRSDVDKIVFTGSVATGRKVAVACAERLVPCTLELGGKDPMIVCSDADIESAAAGAVAGSFMNTGQICCATERVYVVQDVADVFIERVIARAAELRQGVEGEFDVGAMFWDEQLAIVDRHVQDAVQRGAKVAVGGRENPLYEGTFYEPTVLTEVDHSMLVMREETFGPVLPIMRVRDEAEAVRLANDSPYGLAATVWTKDPYRARQMARELHVGGVCINDMTVTYGVPEAPFGGRRNSGLGHVNGPNGLRGYCHSQPVLFDRFGGRGIRSFYPFSGRRDENLKRLVRSLYGTALGRLFL